MARPGKVLLVGLAALAVLAAAGLTIVLQRNFGSAATTDAVMSMRVTGTGTTCTPPGNTPTSCTVPLSGAFNLIVRTTNAPDLGYIGIQTEIDYSELVSHGGNYKPATTQNFGTTELVWAPGTFPLRAPEPPTGNEGLVNHADATALINAPETTDAGDVLSLAMNCSATASINAMLLMPYVDGSNTDASGFKLSMADGGSTVPAKTSPLTVNCGSPPTNTPTRTFTPTITRTPTITPTPTNTPLIPNNYMALQLKGGQVSCDDDLRPSKCSVETNDTFTLAIDAFNPPAGGYVAFRTLLTYPLAYKPGPSAAAEIVWPDADDFIARFPTSPTGNEGTIGHTASIHGGAIPPWPNPSTYTGNLVELDFNCGASPSSGAFSLSPMDPQNPSGPGSWYRRAPDGVFLSAPATSLTVNCVAPTPTPTNTSTPTPTSTNTSTPTNTPTETNTPSNTPTTGPTSTSTATSTPSNTPTPTTAPPTSTPTTAPPTVTPTPTRTPTPAAVPTSTPTRTHTPNPAGTNTPTATSGTPPAFIVGDANDDGVINSLDALWILFYYSGLVDFVPSPQGADANQDGVIDPVDAALILQFEADLIGGLPPHVAGSGGGPALAAVARLARALVESLGRE